MCPGNHASTDDGGGSHRLQNNLLAFRLSWRPRQAYQAPPQSSCRTGERTKLPATIQAVPVEHSAHYFAVEGRGRVCLLAAACEATIKAARSDIRAVPIIMAMVVQCAFAAAMNMPEIEKITAPPATVGPSATPHPVPATSGRNKRTPALAAGMVRPSPNPTKAQGRKKAAT